MVYKIKKGLNIRIEGKAEQIINKHKPTLYAVKPTDYKVFKPKLLVEVDSVVSCGTPLVFNKDNEKIIITSPVSGTVKAINRGLKRVIEEIVIEADNKNTAMNFTAQNPNNLNREDIIEKLLKSGLWTFIHQRPYAIIANPNDTPDSIFISGFDTSPLSPDMSFVMQQHNAEAFQTGINVLKKLTNKKIHLNINSELQFPEYFVNAQNVQINQFSGPHPAGNVGVQIHHISPIIKGDIVWYLYPQDVVHIGHLFLTGKLNLIKIYAVAGSELKKTYYIETIAGANVSEILHNNLKQENVRVISGNVLTGKKIAKDGYLGFFDNMLTVIPEGDYYELFGWAMPGFNKFSMSRTFLSWLCKKKHYVLDTNFHGEKRAFVITGQYEKVFPMKIMPVQLLKSIIADDIDMMEKLGIYEVAPEDFALCEFVCTSKINCQSIVEDGINFMLKEMNYI